MPRSLPVYSSGTVTVAYTNGAWTVTGSGTNFISPDGVPNYTLLAGDAFTIPNVGSGSIAAIASATSFTLNNWSTGPVTTASTYAIYRFEGLPSQQAAALVTQLLTLFTDTNPPAYATVDTGAVRFKLDDDGSGNMRIRARASNAAGGDTAYVTVATFNDATGLATFPALKAFAGDSGSGGAVGGVPAPPSGSAASNEVLGAGGSWVGRMAGFRNRIINGAMAIDQRNDGAGQFITAGGGYFYTIDRFYAACVGANIGGQRVATSSPDQFRYQFTGAAGVTAVGFGQRIEAANSFDLAGTTATLSVELYNSTLTTVTWAAYYANATDNWAGQTIIATGTFTVSSTLAKYTAQIAIPAAATTGINIYLSVGAQTSGLWQIGEMQLEAGQVATPFERRPASVELALSAYYFQQITIGASSGFAVGYAPTASGAFAWLPIPHMRASPTASVSSGSLTYSTPAGTTSSVAVSGEGSSLIQIQASGSGYTGGSSGYFGASSSGAATISLNAEL